MSIESELKENLEYISTMLPLTAREKDLALMQFRYTNNVPNLEDVFASKEFNYGQVARRVANTLLNRAQQDEPEEPKKDAPEFGVNE